MPTTKAFKPSKSQVALGFDKSQPVGGNGFVGTSHWLVRSAGSAARPIPAWIKKEPVTLAVAQAFVRDIRGRVLAAREVRLVEDDHVWGTNPAGPSLDIELESDGASVLAHRVNAHYARHVESCWPIGRWGYLPKGILLRLTDDLKLVGCVACIRPTLLAAE